MSPQALIAGGGIGGLAAALACDRAGWEVRLYEQADAFAEVGAGLQLGPNATRLLHAWGLRQALESVASYPEVLVVRNATSGAELGRLRLGSRCLERYGAPYATLHRSDLHGLLLESATQCAAVRVHLRAPVHHYQETDDAVRLEMQDGKVVEGDALVGADGVWSTVAAQALGPAAGLPSADHPFEPSNPTVQQPASDGATSLAQPTGQVAYRAVLQQEQLPQALRSQHITVWLGERLHVVMYPVRAGQGLNVVVIVQTPPPQAKQDWAQTATAAQVQGALAATCPALQDWVQAVPSWLAWVLCDRPPVAGFQAMAQGRVALLGDAAHPMRPYLAQGAAMALEDAQALGQCLSSVQQPGHDVPPALRRYALTRWQRNARVQARAARNGQIFHATGPLRWARDAAIKTLGQRLLDMPWLYGEPKPRC